ncbi:hypothetical protein Tco_0650664 [Tanacetum coccineum]
MKLSMKKLEILKKNIKFRGGLLGLKDFLMILELPLPRIMTTIAQQIALDNALVALENQHGISKCNIRINPRMKPKEPTYQVFWATINKHNGSYRFKIENKRFFVNVEVFREILNICPKILSQVFDEPPSEEETLSFIRELGYSRKIKYITNVSIDHLHQPWRTFATIINKCLSGKDLAYQIDNKDSKKQDKMLYPRFTKAIIHHFLTKDNSISMWNTTFMHITRDDSLLGAEPPKPKKTQKKFDSAISSEETPSKKKPAKAKKNVPSIKKLATKPKLSKKKALGFLMSNNARSLVHMKELVLNHGFPMYPNMILKVRKSLGVIVEKKMMMMNKDDSDNDDNDDDKEEEEYVDELTDKEDNVDNAKEENKEEIEDAEELYRDVNVNLRKEDVEITDADQGGADQHNVSQESGFEHVEEDAHVTLTPVHDTQKTEGPMQSSSVLSDFTDKLLNFENASSADNEIASLMDTTVSHEEPSRQTSFLYIVPVTQVDQYAQAISSIPTIIDCYIDNKLGEAIQRAIKSHTVECREEALILPHAVSDFATLVIKQNVTESLEVAVLAKPSSQPKSTYTVAASLSEFELMKILMDKMKEHKSYLRAYYKRDLYDALVKSYNTDKDLFETYDEIFTLKRSRDDKDQDQDPSAGLDRGTKRRKSSKDAESSRDPKSKESKSSSSSKGTSRSQHKSSGKSAHAEEPSHIVDDSGVQHNQEFDTGNNDEQPNDEAVSKIDYNIAYAEKPPTSFNELMDTPIDFSAFVMNRLNITNLTQELLVGPEFNRLKGTCKSRMELEYHFEECFKATSERLDWHNLEGKKTLTKDVYSKKQIIIVTSLKIMKWYNYGHLDEIEVRREDQQLYKFKEGDFPLLRLQDIKDMLLLLV